MIAGYHHQSFKIASAKSVIFASLTPPMAAASI
jgi:hypothetical protein